MSLPGLPNRYRELSDSAWSIYWTRRDYNEMKWTRGKEPRKRWLRVIARAARFQWHITIAFEGSLHSDSVARIKLEKRREDLENLCLCLDFDQLSFIDDTVTELLIRRECDQTPPVYQDDSAFPYYTLPLRTVPRNDSEFSPVIAQLRLCVREDPFRVRFPSIDPSSNLLTINLLDISKTCQLSTGVYKAQIRGKGKSYVYKELDIPMYMPRDSQVFFQELLNLQLFRGTEGIAQLVAAVITQNPYQTIQPDETPDFSETMESSNSSVLCGILLEYYSKGTLEVAMRSTKDAPPFSKPDEIRPWRRWALQVSCALASLHRHDITHMDLKPGNVVISADEDAILIDVSGIGGTNREWLAPEMRHISDPMSESADSRVWNDIWALGKLILEMADASRDHAEKKLLEGIASGAMVENPSSRTPLSYISSTLSQCCFLD